MHQPHALISSHRTYDQPRSHPACGIVVRDLQRVAWRVFAPPACQVIARHYVSRGEDEWKATIYATHYLSPAEFEAWIGGDEGVGEEILSERWND